MNRPILGITIGDPAGIGPEIALKALARLDYKACKPLLIGDMSVLKKALLIPGMPNLNLRQAKNPSDALYQSGTADVLDLREVDPDLHEYGKVSAMCGRAAYKYVETAIRLATDGQIQGTVTGPLNKEALHLAGYNYAGHTEIYASLTGTDKYTMLLVHGGMKIVHVTTHVSMRKACDLITRSRVLEVIKLAHEGLQNLGIENPRIGVAGLNPHAGENGLFGSEEIEEIRPAVEDAAALGIMADGPLPPDTAFAKARGGLYDAAVAMYHDQGHIPLKLDGFVWDEEKKAMQSVSGVNITLGLPIIRTSVDHGTAFDLAGSGTATEESLLDAINYGVRLANKKGK